MSTHTIKLKNVPIRITDGTKTAIVQSASGQNFYWCDSLTIPDKVNYQFTSKLNIGLVASIWIWNPSVNDEHEMTVSYTIFGE